MGPFDPPPTPSSSCLSTYSSTRPSDETSLMSLANTFRRRSGWHRWASLSPQHGTAPCQVQVPVQPPEQGSWNGFDRIVAHLLHRPVTDTPASPTVLPLPPRADKPVKSTELSRSDGRSQNSIWCALFVDCVRLAAEGTRQGAYHAETEPPPLHQTPTNLAK